MKTETKVLFSVLAVALLLLIGGVTMLSLNSPKISSKDDSGIVYKVDHSKGQKIGSDSAKVKLVEFSDFQCPACKTVEPYIQDIIRMNYPDFQFIYRNFPLSQHPNARPAANAALEAGVQNKFWQMHDKLFETQNDWTDLPNPADFFAKLATDLGLDGAKIKEAVEKQTHANIIQDDVNEGNSVSINSTPTFYLNGKKLDLGNYNELKTLVEEALK